jgi:TRAP-type C4-dicarboxylate transport system permease small subunit
VLETWCFAIATLLGWYFAYYATKSTYWSWKFNDISQGQDAIALWIPQSAMVIGSVIFAIALTDHLIHVFISGEHRIEADVLEQSHGE